MAGLGEKDLKIDKMHLLTSKTIDIFRSSR